jgi:hypothetical protein
MATDLTKTLQSTIDALSLLDVSKLEQLCDEAEALVGSHRVESERGAFETRALQRTLLELLRSTDENLRVLRELRLRRMRSDDNMSLGGSDRWAR